MICLFSVVCLPRKFIFVGLDCFQWFSVVIIFSVFASVYLQGKFLVLYRIKKKSVNDFVFQPDMWKKKLWESILNSIRIYFEFYHNRFCILSECILHSIIICFAFSDSSRIHFTFWYNSFCILSEFGHFTFYLNAFCILFESILPSQILWESILDYIRIHFALYHNAFFLVGFC